MVQNILVFIFIVAAIANIGNGVRKIWLRKKSSSAPCGGCGNCELKKNLVHHGQR